MYGYWQAIGAKSSICSLLLIFSRKFEMLRRFFVLETAIHYRELIYLTPTDFQFTKINHFRKVGTDFVFAVFF